MADNRLVAALSEDMEHLISNVDTYLDYLSANGSSRDQIIVSLEIGVKADPVPKWRKRVEQLWGEPNEHIALARYVEFIEQTEDRSCLR